MLVPVRGVPHKGPSRREFLQSSLALLGAFLTSSSGAKPADSKLRFGVCGDLALADVAAKAGYDYLEGKVPSLLVPGQDDAAFVRSLEQVRQAPLPCEVLNMLLPAQLRITGEKVDREAVQRHMETVCRRAARAGGRLLVFGSAAARNVPEGFDREKARAQLVEFGRMAGRAAADSGVVVAVEQLNRKESNILNTVRECADLVRAVDSPAFRLTLDGYHWGMEKDTVAEIVAAGPLVAHVHLATWPSRLAPGGETCDLEPFSAALRKIGYSGRVSIEARLRAPAAELPPALDLMRAGLARSEAVPGYQWP